MGRYSLSLLGSDKQAESHRSPVATAERGKLGGVWLMAAVRHNPKNLAMMLLTVACPSWGSSWLPVTNAQG